MIWTYELSYAALLSHSGLVGFVIHAGAFAWKFYAGVQLVRQRPESTHVIVPFLAGAAGFLLVNATNSCLTKFDHLWTTIFLSPQEMRSK